MKSEKYKRFDITYQETERMNMVYKYFVFMELDNKVDSVTDREGELIVEWKIKPTETMMKCAEYIWNILNETLVSHKF